MIRAPKPPRLDARALRQVTQATLGHYERHAAAFRAGTQDHDVSQNIDALLQAIDAPAPLRILDFGCGPGRDLAHFHTLGHEAVGLDGAPAFVAMARTATGCDVWQQDFLALDLPAGHFDGVFANAALFHVPRQELPRVLRQLHGCLKPGGVLFSSNPRGADEEGWADARYGCFLSLETWRALVTAAGFAEIDHYYRPPGKPRREQFWLASLWRKTA